MKSVLLHGSTRELIGNFPLSLANVSVENYSIKVHSVAIFGKGFRSPLALTCNQVTFQDESSGATGSKISETVLMILAPNQSRQSQFTLVSNDSGGWFKLTHPSTKLRFSLCDVSSGQNYTKADTIFTILCHLKKERDML